MNFYVFIFFDTLTFCNSDFDIVTYVAPIERSSQNATLLQAIEHSKDGPRNSVRFFCVLRIVICGGEESLVTVISTSTGGILPISHDLTPVHVVVMVSLDNGHAPLSAAPRLGFPDLLRSLHSFSAKLS
jgi:hypothetical protein